MAEATDIGDAGAGELAHAAARGAIGAMAMSGMRVVMQQLGVIERTPPQAIVKEKARGLMKLVPKKRRPVAVELTHWAVGAAGGAGFGLLPKQLRRAPWSGPAYGIAVLLGYELAVAPTLGLSHSRRWDPGERAGLIADHLLYGLVLNEGRRRPRE